MKVTPANYPASVNFMDTQTLSQVSAEIALEARPLEYASEDSPEYDGQQHLPADARARLVYLREIQEACRKVADYLNGEHAAFHARHGRTQNEREIPTE